jgi:nucleoside-diphosphate-sugar epimerase
VHILILGAAGMVGRKLTERLVKGAQLAGQSISKATLVDVVEPALPVAAPFPTRAMARDIANPEAIAALVGDQPDIIFHLAAIVSGEAEANFEKGYTINLDGTRYLLEAIRHRHLQNAGYRPRLVFTSSIAVFGAPFHEKIDDEFFHQPLTSYGTQKAIDELLLSDFTRKGFVDGIGIRLPTICVRPGAPNAAASGFFSNIIREPLVGREAVLPVSEDVMHWHASPRSAVGFLIRAATIEGEAVGPRRNLTMPGLAVTVAEQIAALRRVAGDQTVALIRRKPDPVIAKIVSGWPRNFDPKRALALGFIAETSFDQIIRAHIDDELGGRMPR